MDNRGERISIALAKTVDLVDYLSALGHWPKKVRGTDYWYICPFFSERTPSFKVSRKLNRWFHFAHWKGGSIIDFGTWYHQCSVTEFLEILQIYQSGGYSPQTLQNPTSFKSQLRTGCKINILEQAPLCAPELITYLAGRKIPEAIAGSYCQQVSYSLYGRQYQVIGFKNDFGGFELRGPHTKLSSSPKSITTFIRGYRSIAIFEGFMDFLSYLVSLGGTLGTDCDFLILNTTAFLGKALPALSVYDQKHLYLDNDQTGQNYSRIAQASGPGYLDHSWMYKDHQDLNDWLVATRK